MTKFKSESRPWWRISEKNKSKNIKRAQRIGGYLARYAVIISLSYMLLYPLLRMIHLGITHPHAMGLVGSLWVPPMVSIDNFRTAWAVLDFWPHFWTTMSHMTLIMILQVVNAALAGYAFARLKFRGSGILFAFVLVTFVVPVQAMALPQRIMMQNFDVFGIITLIRGEPLNLLGQSAGMFIMSAFGMGLSAGLFIYIFRQFVRGLPKELEEAAYVDGAGFLRTFTTIVVPMAKPAFLTVGVLSFIWNYSSIHFINLFNPTGTYFLNRVNQLMTTFGGTPVIQGAINQALSAGRLSHSVVRLEMAHEGVGAYNTAILQVASLIAILPMIILFLIIQKQFVQGVERSGIVG